MLLFTRSAWASVLQGNTVHPLRLGSLVFAEETRGSAKEKVLPSGGWMFLSVRVKATPAPEGQEVTFRPGTWCPEGGSWLPGEGLPLQLAQNITPTCTVGGWVEGKGETHSCMYSTPSETADSSMGPFPGIPSPRKI